jgi:steroid 5-alpha reductase family enzyme
VIWSGLALNVVASAGVLVACLVALWRVGVKMGDVSIIDIFWGPGFVIVALVTLALGDAPFGRRLLVAVLTGVWGLRLGGYLYWRNHGKGEDARYQAMRRHVGEGFERWALRRVFLFQGVILMVVSLPVQIGGYLTSAQLLLPQVVAGVVVWAIGLSFEAVGDAQLARFKADPANAGKVMDRGLWRYTRHPNYFGDSCVWWGISLTVLVHPAGLVGVVGPLLMTLFLVRVSGKALLERRMKRSRPDYDAYIERTSGFFPLPPRAQRSVTS